MIAGEADQVQARDAAGQPMQLRTPVRADVIVDDAWSLYANPANLGYLRGGQFGALMALSERPSPGDGFGVHAAWGTRVGLAVAAGAGSQQLEGATGFGHFAVAWASDFAAVGLRYRWYAGQRDPVMEQLSTSDLGLTLRPTAFWGASLVITDLWTPVYGVAVVPRGFRAATALRTVSGSFEAELGYGWFQGVARELQEASVTVRVRPVAGLQLFGALGVTPFDDARVTRGEAGLIVSLAQVAVASSVDLSTRRGSAAVDVRTRPGPTARVQGGYLYRLELSGSLPERPSRHPLARERRAFVDILDDLAHVATAPGFAGVYVHLSGVSASMAQLWELRRALDTVRASGREVIVYVERGGLKDLYLADAGTFVSMSPAFTLVETGVSVTRTYLAGLLELVGVEAQFVRTGPWKTGPDRFTRGSPSDESNEQVLRYLDAAWAELVEGLCRNREPRACARGSLPGEGPLHARDLHERGWVQELGYEDELPGRLYALTGSRYRLTEQREPLETEAGTWRPRDRFAVLHVTGSIVGGTSGTNPLSGEAFTGTRAVEEAVRAILADDTVVGVLLRVDSPGGSAWASDEMLRAIRRLAARLPVVVSMGSSAASGGYYVAALDAPLVATPLTLTGSIGVYAGTFALDGLLGRLGVTQVRDGRGGPAGLYRGRRWTEDDVAAVQSSIDYTYERFLALVAEARGMTRDEADAVAGGRVYTGAAAREAGLVDEVGGFEQAWSLLCAETGACERRRPELVHYPRSRGFAVPELILARLGVSAGDGGEALVGQVLRSLGLGRALQPLLTTWSEPDGSPMLVQEEQWWLEVGLTGADPDAP